LAEVAVKAKKVQAQASREYMTGKKHASKPVSVIPKVNALRTASQTYRDRKKENAVRAKENRAPLTPVKVGRKSSYSGDPTKDKRREKQMLQSRRKKLNVERVAANLPKYAGFFIKEEIDSFEYELRYY
jgi:hypothetical protein